MEKYFSKDGAQENEISGKKQYSGIVAFGLFAIVSAIVVFFCVSKFNTKLWQERANNFSVVTSQYAQNIEITCDDQWAKVEAANYRLQVIKATHEDELFEVMVDYENELVGDEESIFLYSSQGLCYGSDGKSQRWDARADLVSEEEKQLKIYNLYGTREGMEQMVFLYKMPEEIITEENTFTHIAIIQNMSTFDNVFSSTVYGKNASTYIINDNGTQVFHHGGRTPHIEAYNILQAVKEDEFLFGTSYKKMKEDISTGNSGYVHIKHDGVYYFMAYQPMKSNSPWQVVLILPATYAITTDTEFIRDIITYIVIILLVAMIFIGVVFYISRRDVREKEKLAQKMLVNAAMKEREANEAKSNFLSHISHDIRTPLNGISGMVAKALENVGDEETVTDCLDKIQVSSNHLMSIISDVLDMSRIESGKVELRLESVDLLAILNECADIMSIQAKIKGVSFACNFDVEKNRYVKADSKCMRNILDNILANAVRFTEIGGSVYFRAEETSSDDKVTNIKIEIEDTGIGISEEFLKHIFEPFAQEQGRPRTNYQGTGLGMAIANELVTAMGGKIEVESQMGKGSCFTIYLAFPISKAPTPIPIRENTASFAGMRVLLVEDNALNMEVAKYILSNLEMEIIEAKGGVEALDIFSHSQEGYFDAIFMDVMMPDMDGLATTRAIRALTHPDSLNVPIIAMTANVFDTDIANAKDAGMNGYISKPINPEAIKETLTNVLEREQQ